MIQMLLAAISNSLFQKLGEQYEIFQEEIKQDLEPPCFFLSCINPTKKLFLGDCYTRTNSFCIQYFPESQEKAKEECVRIAEQMFWCLEWITTEEGILRGTQMRYEIDEDAVLHFFVDYDCFVRKKQKKIAMETCQTKARAGMRGEAESWNKENEKID